MSVLAFPIRSVRSAHPAQASLTKAHLGSLSLRFRGLQNGVFAPAAVWRKWMLLLIAILVLCWSEHLFAATLPF